ncbi:MAG: creatininase family protein, partial [Bacteroidetes bacterium]
TQWLVLKDIADVVRRAGIRKLVIMNGHGGNHFKNMLRELTVHEPDLFACAVDWYSAAPWKEYFSDLGDHAGELETSAMLHIAPQWVSPLEEAGDGAAKKFKIKALREGWAISQRKWTEVTADTGVGNPCASTAEKGVRFLEACTQRMAAFFAELAAADPDNLYE